MKLRLAIVSALAAASALGAGAVQARDADVRWSVTIGSPGYGSRAPVYEPVYGPVYGPAPVYMPAPVYVPAPVYMPAPVYRAPRPVVVYPHQIYYREPTRWDRDGDGIPNRHDRVHNPAWDRDGDGIPNRHDRRGRDDQRRWDNDRDGVPDRWDRYDHNPGRR